MFEYTYLLLSVLVIVLAHLVRIYRWRLFLVVYELPSFSTLLKSLSLGYAANIFLPFKTGDLLRAFYCGAKLRNGKSLSFSSVVVERILDVVFVGMFFAVVALFGRFREELNETLLFYSYIAFAILALGILIFCGKKIFKKTVRGIGRIFNQNIELKILKFFWAIIRNFKDIATKVTWWKLLLSTFLMWSLYIASYFLFSKSIFHGETAYGWMDIFFDLFAKDSLKYNGIFRFGEGASAFFLYQILPLVLLFLLSFLPKAKKQEGRGDFQKMNLVNLIPHINQDERLAFLEKYFSGEYRNFIQNYLRINSDISIIHDYSAGSNATTMLCMSGEGSFFRKYAFGADGEKLYEQVLWIEEFKDILPLPKILRKEKTSEFCYYDMPAVSGATGLFEYAHSVPIEKSWSVIKNALETLEKSLYVQNRREADRKTIQKYIETKVLKNIRKIQSAQHLKPLMKYDVIIINGRPFKNLPNYLSSLSLDFLEQIFICDSYSDIHGDLTIENIICTRNADGKDDWYIIDPNTGNVHDSPNLDYGKLLQSIAGGYEFLMKTQNVEVSENRVNFIFTKSNVYEILHKKLDEFMFSNFSRERVRSIYYHHIIHWLRLLPYKIEKNGIRCVLFYAGLLMVLDEVEKKFGDEK